MSSDPRVESIWLCGSLARGEADEFSDLDMAVLIEESDYPEFMQESREEKWDSLGAEGGVIGGEISISVEVFVSALTTLLLIEF